MIYEKLKKHWNIQKKIRLIHQDNWNGETIIPVHNDEVVFRELKPHNEDDSDDVVVGQIIERKFGDLLKEEVE